MEYYHVLYVTILQTQVGKKPVSLVMVPKDSSDSPIRVNRSSCVEGHIYALFK